MTISDTSRTEKQIVADANALARDFYGNMGYVVPKGYRFDKASHPQERSCWNLACLAYLHIQGTDVEDCLAGMDED